MKGYLYNRPPKNSCLQLRNIFSAVKNKPYGLVIIKNFLKHDFAEKLYSELEKKKFNQWIAYLDTKGNIYSHFEKTLSDKLFITIHKRTISKIKCLINIHYDLRSSDFFELLYQVTGIKVSGIRPIETAIVHKMSYGDFIQEQTDYGSPELRTKLVISLSMTKNWNYQYGGITNFNWGKSINICPEFNSAILFSPHQSSFHSVSKIVTKITPPRYTITFHYF